MLKNYLIVALRNLNKNRVLSVINILSLSIGLTLCILISLFVFDELRFDSFHTKKDRIYRIVEEEFDENNQTIYSSADCEIPLGPSIISEIPEIEAYTRINSFEGNILNGTQLFKETVLEADPGIFNMFSIDFIKGNPNTALNDLNNLVISESMSEKLFGKANPMNQSVDIKIGNDFETFKITGVVKNIPNNSTIAFEMCVPFENLKRRSSWIADKWNNWMLSGFPTFIMLKKDQFPEKEAMRNFYLSKHSEDTNWMRENDELAEDEFQKWTYGLQALEDIHLNTEVNGGLTPVSDPKYSYILIAIALFILVIACVNYINLNIARSVKRSVEVGIRKVVGASRTQIMKQFLNESLFITLLAFALALILVDIFLPEFNILIDKDLSFDTIWQTELLIFIPLIIIVSGLISGIYPALFLSGIKVQSILKKKIKAGGNNKFTFTLIGLQFLLAAFFLSGNFILHKQLNFMKNKKLGYKGDQIIRFNINEVNLNKLKTKLSSNPDIIDIQSLSHSIGRGRINTNIKVNGDDSKTANIFGIESAFPEMMEMEFVKGRGFNPNNAQDTAQCVIVNQSFAEYFFPDVDPINQEIEVMGFEMKKVKIIGIVEDFVYSSAGDKIDPAVLVANSAVSKRVGLIKIDMRNHERAIANIENAWYELFPNTIFEFRFIADDMERLYRDESRWAKISFYSTISTILICIMGLFGMAAILLVNRTKEIGIRKVLGADFLDILLLFFRQYFYPMIFAFLISIPICIYIANIWLENYHNRISIDFGDFFYSGMILLSCITATILFFSIRGNRINPAYALKND